MRPDEYWKNFNLGTELDIAGRFLFNGLQFFDQMKTFSREEDAFEFLYSISVGVERILKIAIILTEHAQNVDQSAFEADLITHNHQDLMNRLCSRHKINLGKAHNDLLSMLSKFYKSHRYGRYSLVSVYSPAEERDALIRFLEKHLSSKIDYDGFLTTTRNDWRFKKFVGKIVSGIVIPAFEVVRSEARRLNIYTYEIEYGSKASKIFQSQKFDFENEEILHIELIAYLVSDVEKGANVRLIQDNIRPLQFDPALESDYLAALRTDLDKLAVLDELEQLYQEGVANYKERRSAIEAAQSPHLSLFEDEGDDNDDDDL